MERISVTLPLEDLDTTRLLADWRWLVPESLTPFAVTLFADWFFEDAGGRIFFLDIIGGRLTPVAPNREIFYLACAEEQRRQDWYRVDLAMACWRQGLRPESGECLGLMPPVDPAAQPTVDDVGVCELGVHLSMLGQMHRQDCERSRQEKNRLESESATTEHAAANDSDPTDFE